MEHKALWNRNYFQFTSWSNGGCESIWQLQDLVTKVQPDAIVVELLNTATTTTKGVSRCVLCIYSLFLIDKLQYNLVFPQSAALLRSTTRCRCSVHAHWRSCHPYSSVKFNIISRTCVFWWSLCFPVFVWLQISAFNLFMFQPNPSDLQGN